MNSILLKLCQWDFTSYGEAIAASPYETDTIFYRKAPLVAVKPLDQPIDPVCTYTTHQLRIEREPFGFYSWLPTDATDRSIVLEHRVKPNPWTDFQPSENDAPLIKFICSTVEGLIGERSTFLMGNMGINCTREQGLAFQFVVMFAKRERSPAVFVNFAIPRESMICSESLKIEQLDIWVDKILMSRRRLIEAN